MKSSLEIISLTLQLHLGVTNEERATPQSIEFDIKISFDNLPDACSSDKIHETICYEKISESLESYLADKHFHLIEHLCHEVYQYIKNSFLSSKDKLNVKVSKKPPIDNIKGKCFFCIENN